MKKIFLSFGNNRFINSRRRILKEVMALRYNSKSLFDEFKIETESVINEPGYIDVINKIPTKLGTGRGYYWWTWKPYIMYKTLCTMNDGDILFYCDSGMSILNNDNTVKKFNELFELITDINKCETGIITFITTGPKNQRLEYMYNTLSVFEHFNVENIEDITHTQQCQAGVNMICKTKKSIEIMTIFYETALKHPELFVCDQRVFPNFNTKTLNGFKDHRHDQSIWSVLMKIYKCNVLDHNKNPMRQTHYRE